MNPLVAMAVALVTATGAQAKAQEWSLYGGIETELRGFLQSPQWRGQTDRRVNPSLALDARLTFDFGSGTDRLVIAPFARLSDDADGRTHADLREAYWLHQGDSWSLTAGLDKVFWGVADSRHLVDIVNQDDVLEGLDGSEKLGQPMLALRGNTGIGTFEAFALPWFRPRHFAPAEARLTSPLPIAAATYSDPDGYRNVDYALRWSQGFGNLDLGLSWFRGTSREPVFLQTATTLVPRYDVISQAGLDAQLTLGAWAWKLEAIRRGGQGPAFNAVTAGVEWTLGDVAATGGDLSLLAEYNHDGRDKRLAPPTVYDDDLFLGFRFGLNDIAGTELKAGVLVDRDTPARIFSIEGQRRLGDDWRIAVEGRFVTGAVPPGPAAWVAQDDYISISLRRSF